jgi:hypothetical protein
MVHDADDCTHHFCCLLLAEVTLLCDAVKELSPLADLHYKVDVALVLKGAALHGGSKESGSISLLRAPGSHERSTHLELHHVLVARQMQQNLDLSPHVLDVIRSCQLAL